MHTDIPLLRFMVLSAIVGFIVFCASYAALVWKKRRKSATSGSGFSSRLRGWSITALVLGCLGLITTFVVREAVSADGMMNGDGLQAIRARPDLRVVQVADEGPIKEGDVLVRFSSPDTQAEIMQAEINLERERNKKEQLALQPLPVDPKLNQQLQFASATTLQHQINFNNARQNSDSTIRDLEKQLGEQRDNVAKIENERKLESGNHRIANAKLDITKKQLTRERDLAKKTGGLSTSDLNDREKEAAALEAEIVKLEASLAAIDERLRTSKESLEAREKIAAKQKSEQQAQVDAAAQDYAAAKEKYESLEKKQYEEEQVAGLRRGRELADLDFQIKQVEHLIASKREKLVEKAQANGRVIYRNASPGMALNERPVLVMGPPDGTDGGMRFQFRLPEDQVPALRQAGGVMIELAETANSIEQRFPGKFLQATPLTREPGMALVDLDCQASPETVASLAEGKSIKARFSWRPPALSLWPFQLSLALLAVGVCGLFLSSVSNIRSSWPAADEDDALDLLVRAPGRKEGDTAEAAADTIPIRPDIPTLPREKAPQAWEHPVGIRLRDAIVREDVSLDLLDAVEGAIERQQDAVIGPLREALRRAPSVPVHARRFLDSLNNFESNDEFKVIEKRCIAQRLTFLFYTLGLEIPSDAGRSSGVRAVGS